MRSLKKVAPTLFCVLAFFSSARADVPVGAAKAVLQALQKHDMKALAPLVHPVKGVRFSNYGSLEPGDPVFQGSALEDAMRSPLKSFQVVYPGSNEPVALTFSEYFDRFVYDRDFLAAPEITKGRGPSNKPGTAKNDYRAAYPHDRLVECTFPLSAQNWSRLILAFEKYQGDWRLVAIIHDEWTV